MTPRAAVVEGVMVVLLPLPCASSPLPLPLASECCRRRSFRLLPS